MKIKIPGTIYCTNCQFQDDEHGFCFLFNKCINPDESHPDQERIKTDKCLCGEDVKIDYIKKPLNQNKNPNS